MASEKQKENVETMAAAFRTHVADATIVLRCLPTSGFDPKNGSFDQLSAWSDIRDVARRQQKPGIILENLHVPISEFTSTLDSVADVFGVHSGEVAVVLTALGTGFDPLTGVFDAEVAFNRLRDIAETEGYSRVNDVFDYIYCAGRDRPLSIEKISDDSEIAREQFQELMTAHGMRFIRRELRGGACQVYERPKEFWNTGSKRISVLTYFASAQQSERSSAANSAMQFNFRISYLDRHDQYEWVALIVAPLNRVYLRKMEEIREGRENRKSANTTIREGTPSSDLFESRIGELVTGEGFDLN